MPIIQLLVWLSYCRWKFKWLFKIRITKYACATGYIIWTLVDAGRTRSSAYERTVISAEPIGQVYTGILKWYQLQTALYRAINAVSSCYEESSIGIRNIRASLRSQRGQTAIEVELTLKMLSYREKIWSKLQYQQKYNILLIFNRI